MVTAQARLVEFRPADAGRWDAYVEAHPEGSFFHLAGWAAVLREAFGHRTHYLQVERDGRIEGVLPLGEIRSRLFGHALISTPFCVCGGVLADHDQARDLLLAAARERAHALGVAYLELRNRMPLADHGDWLGKDLYVNFSRRIDADPEVNLKAIPRKQRAVVRKGMQSALVGDLDDDLATFYAMYSESVRNLGTPVFGRRYFEVLRRVFGERSDILTIRHRGEAVASVMSFYFRDQVLPYYGGGTAAARGLKANDFMYWELMCHAAERGVRVFDFGRSKLGSGSCSFKKNWGFEPEPLAYQYHLVRATELPNVSPTNPRYQLFIKAWQRLPLWLSQRLGPWLARDLG